MVCGTFLKHLGRPKLVCSQKNSQGHLKVMQGHLKVILVLLKGMLRLLPLIDRVTNLIF